MRTINTKEIYLDHSATTKVCDAAVQAMIHAMTCEYGNAASLHRKGFLAEQAMRRHKQLLADALGCQAEELLITSGATESNNLAISGILRQYPRLGKRIVTTAMEHASVHETLLW